MFDLKEAIYVLFSLEGLNWADVLEDEKLIVVYIQASNGAVKALKFPLETPASFFTPLVKKLNYLSSLYDDEIPLEIIEKEF